MLVLGSNPLGCITITVEPSDKPEVIVLHVCGIRPKRVPLPDGTHARTSVRLGFEADKRRVQIVRNNTTTKGPKPHADA